MHEQSIAIYCICETVLQTFRTIDDPQCKMSTSEVMTFALLSAIHYQCDYKKTHLISKNLKLFFKNLSV